jgi:L-ribulose-5-phosphate 4-epimerase
MNSATTRSSERSADGRRMIDGGLRREVLDTALALQRHGLVWMAGGTVCGRDPASGHVVVTPSGMAYEGLEAADMIVVDGEGNLIEGRHRPSVATNLWTAILRARPDVQALIHTHSPYATAFSVVGVAIPVVTETQANWFGGPVPVVEYRHLEDADFASAPAEALGEGFAVLLGQHGPITVGCTLPEALDRAVTLEEAAKIYTMAKVLGRPAVFSQEQAARSFDYYQNRYGQRGVIHSE